MHYIYWLGRILKIVFLFIPQAGEFFHSAQSIAAAQQREMEAQQTEESLDTPLLTDQVRLDLLICFVCTSHVYPAFGMISWWTFVQEKSGDPSKQVQLGFFTGLVPREKSMPFERILFRATRGNVFLRQTTAENPVTDPASGEKVQQNISSMHYFWCRGSSFPIKNLKQLFSIHAGPLPYMILTSIKFRILRWFFVF